MGTVGKLDGQDIAVVAIYFAIIIAVGIWSSCRNRGSVGGYFLAGRSMHFVLVGASLFASNIGSGHFIGLAGSGAATGIGITVFELNAIFILIILGWGFLPVYLASGVFTMPEYLRKRFGGQRIRVFLAVLALVLSIFTKISADLYAGAVFIEQSLELSLYPAVIILLLISGIFTILGGLTAVIWTDFAQTIIMLIGAFFLMIASFVKVGGYTALVEGYFSAIPKNSVCPLLTGFSIRPASVTTLSPKSAGNTTSDHLYRHCGLPPANAMHLMRSADDASLPWPGVIFGLTINSIWYWCSDQVIVQRTLAAKNLTHAKAATIFAGWLKLLPMWLLVFPGMAARILFPEEVGCASPSICLKVCGKRTGCSDTAYPRLVLSLMPVGAKGLMLAVMVASLVSSLTSIFNSSSTLFTVDIWRRFRRRASDVELMIVGRVFVLGMIVVGVLWIPIVKSGGELFHYIQSVTSYLAPPVCAIYLLAVFWARCNEKGAFWGLIAGIGVGLIRFIWESAYPKLVCGEEALDTRLAVISRVHYLHMGIIIFIITLLVAVVVSMVTAPIPEHHLYRLLFWNQNSGEDREDLDLSDQESLDGVDNPALDASVNTISIDQNDQRRPPHKSETCLGKCFDRMPPWLRKTCFWICGIEHMTEELVAADNDTNPPEHTDADHTYSASEVFPDTPPTLEDDEERWNRAASINALLLISVALFFWGFFA